MKFCWSKHHLVRNTTHCASNAESRTFHSSVVKIRFSKRLPGHNEVKQRPIDPSLDSTMQQPCSDHGCNTISPDDGPEIFTTLQIDCIKELRKIEQNLKYEIQDYRKDLYKLVNEKISQIRMGFEEFKHNINLDQIYRKQHCRKFDPEESDSINSDAKVKKLSNACYGNIGGQNK